MQCFYHPDIYSVGICTRCGKSGCHECIADVGGSLLCRSCIDLQRRQSELNAQQEGLAGQAEVNRANNRIRWSWIVASIGVLFGAIAALVQIASAVSNEPNALPLPAALLLTPVFCAVGAYMFWSYYWGIPTVWHWWRSFTANVGCFIVANPLVLILLVVCFFYIPFAVAGYYGMFGGAIYQYFKHRRIATNGTPLSSSQKKILVTGLAGLAIYVVASVAIVSIAGPRSPGATGQPRDQRQRVTSNSAICSDAIDQSLQSDSDRTTLDLQSNCWSGTVTVDESSLSYAKAHGLSLITTRSTYANESAYSVFCGNGRVFENVSGEVGWYTNRGCPPPYRFRSNSALDVWITSSVRR